MFAKGSRSEESCLKREQRELQLPVSDSLKIEGLQQSSLKSCFWQQLSQRCVANALFVSFYRSLWLFYKPLVFTQ